MDKQVRSHVNSRGSQEMRLQPNSSGGARVQRDKNEHCAVSYMFMTAYAFIDTVDPPSFSSEDGSWNNRVVYVDKFTLKIPRF